MVQYLCFCEIMNPANKIVQCLETNIASDLRCSEQCRQTALEIKKHIKNLSENWTVYCDKRDFTNFCTVEKRKPWMAS